MLTVIFAWMSLFITTRFVPDKHLWSATVAQGLMVSFFSIKWLYAQELNYITHMFFIDKFSASLAMLACWLFPLTLIASQNKIHLEPLNRQRTYIYNAIFLQLMTLLAFTASNYILFFIYFEASLIPTIIIITRWGAQQQRINASMYFAIYTLLGAAPLMVFLLYFHKECGSLWIPLLNLIPMNHTHEMSYNVLFWLLCNLAFLIKMPLYWLHLWLPKAHVEAPIAGSMILAGTLLKLGGYGIMRMSHLFEINISNTTLLMTLPLLGVLATAFLCMRQTDLKSLIAMSSISHMNLVIIASMINTPTSFSGAMLMMIAHGLISSALFCLANTTYDRTNSRTMIILRGSLIIMPLASAWWLFALLFNMALPPSINFTAELSILMSIYYWSPMAFLITTMNLLITTGYTLYVLLLTQRGSIPSHLKTIYPFNFREHIILLFHLFPAAYLTLNPMILT